MVDYYHLIYIFVSPHFGSVYKKMIALTTIRVKYLTLKFLFVLYCLKEGSLLKPVHGYLVQPDKHISAIFS